MTELKQPIVIWLRLNFTFLVGDLKVTNEFSRIRKSKVWIRESGTVSIPKCHGFGPLFGSLQYHSEVLTFSLRVTLKWSYILDLEPPHDFLTKTHLLIYHFFICRIAGRVHGQVGRGRDGLWSAVPAAALPQPGSCAQGQCGRTRGPGRLNSSGFWFMWRVL